MNNYIVSKNSNAITSTNDLPIRYDLYVPTPVTSALPVIIFLHGFKGFKDWGPFPDACIELAEHGYAVLAMNFSMNGIGDNPTEFDRLDLFAKNTLTQELEDIKVVLQALKNGTISSDKAGLDTSKIGIVGHSRGGLSAIVAAANYDEISCLVTWAAVADYSHFWTDEMVNDWINKSYTEILNSRTGQKMRLDKVLYDDAVEHADELKAINRVKELYIPVCFIHGKEDEAVSYKNVNLLYENCPSSEKKRIIIPRTGHTFNGAHPFEDEELPAPFAEVLEHTINWFDSNL
ncbi:MAG TPA: alpha/beta fold hydrolase [Balneolales bacterium]|nr:alpha/beta fold hydrolase [Balneolales bacterium]